MSAISVQNLSKSFQIYKKGEGFLGSVQALVKRRYETLHAVQDVNFEIQSGELVGFLGPNGAGKTTTLKMLSGLLYPTSGQVSVSGFKPFDRKAAFLKNISLVMGQKSQLWMDLPAIESFNLQKEIYQVPTPKYKEILNELVELLDLKEAMYNQVRKLSLGQRMKCELVAALLYQPQVLFLDEPTIGLDVVSQKKVREFIKHYNQSYGATIILTSHYMEDVKELCERIILINHGHIFYDGKTIDLIKQYAPNKTIIATFHSEPSLEQLKTIGEIQSYENPIATLLVAREKTTQKAQQLMQEFDVDDIEINEPKLEDIIQQIF